MRQTTGTRKSPGEKIVKDIKRAKPRLLSDNGSSYVSGDLAEWLQDNLTPMEFLKRKTMDKMAA